MIKEMATSLRNRHHFIDSSKISDWMNQPKDTYMSLYDYDEHVIEYVKEKGKLSGYNGLIYMPDEFLLDVDGSSPAEAKDKTVGLTLLLKDLMIPYNIYFSGTGFHVGIPSSAFRWKPDKNLHIKVKQALTHAGIFEYADPSVTDKTRIIRLLNTRNSKSGKWKICIKESMLFEDVSKIVELARFSNNNAPEVLECEPVFDVFTQSKEEEKAFVESNKTLGRKPDPMNYPCIQSMMEGTQFGNRHAYALRIAAHLRWLYPEPVVQQVMEYWRQRVDLTSKPFTVKEMESIVNSAYEAHGGTGNRYGCEDAIKDSLCQNTCRLYKAKASHSVMGAKEMEKTLIEFFTISFAPITE